MSLPQINARHLSIVARCPDCPAPRLGIFRDLVEADTRECPLSTLTLEARAAVPSAWSERYAFGLIRRGVLVRQRLNRNSDAVAVDAAGPGCVYFPEPGTVSGDYAATDLLVCLLPREEQAKWLSSSRPLAEELLAMQRATLQRVERITQARGARKVAEGVASLLCTLSDTLSPPRQRDRLPAGLQQRDLARLIGVRHETFCRVLGQLEREGAIKRDPDGLAIVDRARLDAIARL